MPDVFSSLQKLDHKIQWSGMTKTNYISKFLILSHYAMNDVNLFAFFKGRKKNM